MRGTGRLILTCERTPSWRRPRNGGRYRLLANLTPPRRLLASMGRNRQVPRRSGSAIGVASEVILRETACRHPQWHQVGSRNILLQRASSALRTRATTGVKVVLEGGDLLRVADLRGPLLFSSSTSLRRTIPGPPDRGRVERLHNGLCRWTRVPPLLRRRWWRRRCRQQQRRARCLPLHRG